MVVVSLAASWVGLLVRDVSMGAEVSAFFTSMGVVVSLVMVIMKVRPVRYWIGFVEECWVRLDFKSRITDVSVAS